MANWADRLAKLGQSLSTTGVVPDAKIDAAIARDSEVTSAVSTHAGLSDPHPGYLTPAEGNAAYDAIGAAAAAQAASQPVDSDLTAIAALTTTSYGRAFLALADAAAARTALALGTAATHATGDYDAAGAAAAAQSASQPLDSDLTAIAALTTTAFGRALLALADPADATKFLNGAGAFSVPPGTGGGGAPTDATYLVTASNGGLSAEVVVPTAVLSVLDDTTVAAMVDTLGGASSTGTGGLVRATSPTLVTPALGTPASGVATNLTGTAAGLTAGHVSLARDARSSNTILAAADAGKLIACSSAFTQTLTAAATLGAGWWVIVKNDTNDGTTALVIDPNGSETIDGLTTITMYSGETRLLTCDGSNFFTALLEGGFAKFTPSGGNFIVPAGIRQVQVMCIGGGGQGGGGASCVSTARSGGGGGGGGAASLATIRPGDLGAAGSTITVTVGAGGSSGGQPGGAGAGANASDGANGVMTTFGALLKAGGGGGGKGGSSANAAGGGGGSAVNSGVTSTGGAPTTTGVAVGSQSAQTSGSNNPGSEWGGASGGVATTSSAGSGQCSIYGGPSGGAGGWCTSGNVGGSGTAGGTTQANAAGGGGTLGTGGASTTAGGDGTTFVGPYCGAAGGGGGGGTAIAGKNGGAGGIGAAGGGGGSSSSATSSAAGGNGGAGGPGECRVWYS